MATFSVQTPSKGDGESGYEEVETTTSQDKALKRAHELAEEQGELGAACVEEVGTNKVWSVQFLPDVVPEPGEGRVIFRVVHDPTEASDDGVLTGHVQIEDEVEAEAK